MTRGYDRPVIPRYSRPEMAGVWSDEGKLARWLDVELAALDGWVEVGVVPARGGRRDPRDGPSRPTRRASPSSRPCSHHDTAAFVDAVAEQLGEEGRWFHYGLTSSDVVDTALSLQLQAAGELVLDGARAGVRGRRRARAASTATRSASAGRTASTRSRRPSG